MRLLITFFAALSLCVTVAACGGSGSSGTSKKEYREKVQSIGNKFKNEINESRTKLQGATSASARSTVLAEFKSSFDKLAKEIDDLEPPSGAQKAQDRVVAALRRAASGIEDVQTAVKSNNASQARTAATSLQKDSAEAQAALLDLKKKVE